MAELLDTVRAELSRYEHPLFAFDARPAPGGVEVLISFKPSESQVHVYSYVMLAREIENRQFPWTFQKQLYDCLHDFVIEMFTNNPQRQDG
ncbi:MAG: hypothetical protein M1453_04800 [Acidobacteria bacterium]|nr:hypothetical protein [Acidobacteriota bacterium]MCL5287300.1 hypothetical protein [Acidobacteriota bacterium]